MNFHDSLTTKRDSSEALVDIRGVGKVYRGRRVLGGIDVTVRRGEVLGLVGPNGAGKTTLIKIIAAMARPSEGAGEVLGRSIGSAKGQAPFLGMMPEHPAFIEQLSGRRNLALLFGIRGVKAYDVIDSVLSRVGLDPGDARPVRAYSQGMRQRLSLAQAIGERPPLLVLDEPTNGLDPIGIIELRTLIRELADEGMGVLLASHLLGEVEAVCDRVMLFKQGAVIRTFSPASKDAEARVVVEVERETDTDILRAVAGVTVLEVEGTRRLVLRVNGTIPETVRALTVAGVGIEAIYRDRETLERAYLQEVGGA